MDFINIIIISFIEGVTEFIPVSSTGHMLIADRFLNLSSGENGDTFIIFIQLGAILGALFLYPGTFVRLIPTKRNIPEIIVSKRFPSYAHIFVAIAPVMIAGFLFYSAIRELLFNVYTVSFALMVGGVMMIAAEKLSRPGTKKLEDISIKQSLIIGLFQCLALIPGMSRSASCIIGGLCAGVRLKPAVNFSFIIAVPVMTAAVAYELLKNYSTLSSDDTYAFALGFVLSFVFAFISMKLFLRILSTVRLTPFGIYRIIAGAVILYIAQA